MEPRTASERAAAAVWQWRTTADPGTVASRARQARTRGLVQGAIGLAAASAVYLLWKTPFAWVIAGIAATIALLALASPLGAYAAVERGLATFGRWVGTAVTWILMPLLYWLLFLPVGLLLRARRRLRVTRGFDRGLPTYLQPTAKRRDGVAPYERQF